MATKTLAQLREGFSITIGDFVKCTASGNGAAGGTTAVDASLVQFPDDYFNNWWCLITSGTYIGQVGRISDFTSSTGTVTVSEAFGGQIASAVTFELHRYYPGGSAASLTRPSKHQALNDAALQLWPKLYVSKYNTELVSGSGMPNQCFEDWAAATNPDWWTITSGTVTTAKETTIIHSKAGTNALKLTGTTAAYRSLKWPDSVVPELEAMKGHNITWYCWVRSDAVDGAWITIADSNGNTSSSKVTATNVYELLDVSHTIYEDATWFEFRCNVAAGQIGYFDTAWLEGGPIVRAYRLSTSITRQPRMIYIARADLPEAAYDLRDYEEVMGWRVEGHGNDRRLRFDYQLDPGKRMMIEYMEPLTTLSSDTDTIELDSHEVQLLYSQAAVLLFERLMPFSPSDEKAHIGNLLNYWSSKTDRMKATLGMKPMAPRIRFKSPLDPRY